MKKTENSAFWLWAATAGILSVMTACGDLPLNGPKQVERQNPFRSEQIAEQADHPQTIRPVLRQGASGQMSWHYFNELRLQDQAAGSLLKKKSDKSDAELLDLINQTPPLASKDLTKELEGASPLSGEVLIAAINRVEPMHSKDIKRVLDKNSPLSEAVINEVLRNSVEIDSNDLDDIMDKQDKSVDKCKGTIKAKHMSKGMGGKLEHCDHEVIAPKGALKFDHALSIQILDSDYIDVEFGPDGKFDGLVTVVISYDDADMTGVDEVSLTIAWFDEKTSQWIDLGGTIDTEKKTVTGYTNHFTQFTLSTN